MKCLNCDTEIKNTPKKREKVFCDNTCRSNYWQKSKRLEGQGLTPEQIIAEIKKSVKAKPENKPNSAILPKSNTSAPKSRENTKNEVPNAPQHPLFKSTDPKEGTGAFFMKYDCMSYDELEKLKK